MGSYDNLIKIEEIRKKIEEGDLQTAQKILDTMDLKKIRNILDMNLIAEVYVGNGKYEEAKEWYLKIYDETHSRKSLFNLLNIIIKLNELEDALYYYEQYEKIAPNDFYNYVFRYYIEKLKGGTYENQIAILEELKRQDYIEEWAYELAKLYYKAGMEEECIRECSDIILWFGEGPYVEKAKILRSYYLGEAGKEEIMQELKRRAQWASGQNAYDNSNGNSSDDAESSLWNEEAYYSNEYDSNGYDSKGYDEGEAYPSEDDAYYNNIEHNLMADVQNYMDEETGYSGYYEGSGYYSNNEENAGDFGNYNETAAYSDNNVEGSDYYGNNEGAGYLGYGAENSGYYGNSEEAGYSGYNIENPGYYENNGEADYSGYGAENSDYSGNDEEADYLSHNGENVAYYGYNEEAAYSGDTGYSGYYNEDESAYQAYNNAEVSQYDYAAAQEQYMQEYAVNQHIIDNTDNEYNLLGWLETEYNIDTNELFGDFIQDEEVKEQLIKCLENILLDEVNNTMMLISGPSGSGKTTLAKKMAIFLNRIGRLKTSKLAKVKAEKLNTIDIFTKMDVIKDCCLLVENASSLTKKTLERVLELSHELPSALAVVFEENNENLDELFGKHPKLSDLLQNRIHMQ